MAVFARRVSLTTVSLLLGRRTRAQKCYYPDQAVEPFHVICNASAQVSLCCKYGATCLTNGLCFSKWDTSFNTGTCTDQTWTDPSCFQNCPRSTEIDHGFNTLYRCDDNRWCCSTGGNFTSCCNDYDVDLFGLKEVGAVMGGTGFQTGFTIAPFEPLQTRQSTEVTSDSTVSSNASSESQSTVSAGKDVDAGRGSSSDRTEIGLGVGLGVGLPLLAGFIVILVFIRRLRSQIESESRQRGKGIDGVVRDGDKMTLHRPVEMGTLPSEMSNSRREITQELGA